MALYRGQHLPQQGSALPLHPPSMAGTAWLCWPLTFFNSLNLKSRINKNSDLFFHVMLLLFHWQGPPNPALEGVDRRGGREPCCYPLKPPGLGY